MRTLEIEIPKTKAWKNASPQQKRAFLCDMRRIARLRASHQRLCDVAGRMRSGKMTRSDERFLWSR